MQGASGEFPLNRDHRQEGGAKAGLNSILDGLEGIEFHLDPQTLHIEAGAG